MTMLRSIRERKGLTVSQLAARASIPSRVIADYEEGRLAMPLNHARLIAKALWVPIEDLMPPAGTVPPPSPAPAPTAPQPQYATAQPRSDAGSVSQQVAPRTEAPAYAPAPPSPRSEPQAGNPAPAQAPREQRPQEGGRPRGVQQSSRGAPGDARQTRPARSLPHPPGPISEGQLQELSRLAARLEIDQQQMEARIGKQLAELTRPEARDWIKKLRSIADEIAPSQRVHYGVWPEAQEDREAAYLRQQRDANAAFTFKLFNGEQFDGAVADFTPYTITVRLAEGDQEVVLRKLAIAYYRRTGAGSGAAPQPDALVTTALTDKLGEPPASDTLTQTATLPETLVHDHARDNHHQPVANGIDSDHVGEPEVPEEDNMDEDRGV